MSVACLGVLTTLATTSAVGISGEPRERGSGGLAASVHRGDSLEVTVHTVSDVDLFEGAEPATGLFFRARIAGVRRMAGCWVAESRDTARDLLRGKNVRLVVRKEDASGSDRMAVDVQLPDGADYAQTIVRAGVAAADLSDRGELAPDETTARQERRGLWATDCLLGDVAATSTSVPPSSSSTVSSPTTTTTTSTAAESSAPPSSSATSSPPSADGRLGKPCLLEGLRRTTEDGGEIVCARNDQNQLRWRRAD